MKTILVTNGEGYSDYSVITIVRIPDDMEWRGVLDKVAKIIAGPEYVAASWHLDNDKLLRALAQVPGVEVLDYEECWVDVVKEMRLADTELPPYPTWEMSKEMKAQIEAQWAEVYRATPWVVRGV